MESYVGQPSKQQPFTEMFTAHRELNGNPITPEEARTLIPKAKIPMADANPKP